MNSGNQKIVRYIESSLNGENVFWSVLYKNASVGLNRRSLTYVSVVFLTEETSSTRIAHNLRSFSATFEKHEETLFRVEFKDCYCDSNGKWKSKLISPNIFWQHTTHFSNVYVHFIIYVHYVQKSPCLLALVIERSYSFENAFNLVRISSPISASWKVHVCRTSKACITSYFVSGWIRSSISSVFSQWEYSEHIINILWIYSEFQLILFICYFLFNSLECFDVMFWCNVLNWHYLTLRVSHYLHRGIFKKKNNVIAQHIINIFHIPALGICEL